MATLQTSLAEYLRTSYHPDRDYVDGEVQEDRISRYNERLADYQHMGIANVWVIDPANRAGYDCSTAAWLPKGEFRVNGSSIFLRLSELWAELEANR